MPFKNRADKIIVQKIIGYCKDIEDSITDFKISYETYESVKIYRSGLDNFVFQLCELTNRLSEEFKAEHEEIKWHKMRGLRNIHAHDYEKIKADKMWAIISKEIPELQAQLEQILAAEKTNDVAK